MRRPLPAVRVLGALKLPLSGADYDDDPASSSEFVVGPSTQLGTTQQASAFFAIPTEATEPTAQVYTAVRATSETGPIVFHGIAAAADLVRGAPCEAALAPPGVSASIAGGLVDTGQLAGTDAVHLVTDCRLGRVALLTVPFPVPRELPPGQYSLCAGAITPDGYGAAPTCRGFAILGVSALATDIGADGIALGDLRSGVASLADGDFALGNAAATIVNAGNTAPVIAVRIEPLTLEEPAASSVTVRGAYTVAVRAAAREGKPSALESQAAFLVDTTPAMRQFSAACLAPGETAALDFGVTPQGALASGSYGGALRVSAGGAAACPSRSVSDSMRVTPPQGPFAAGWVPSTWTWARDADGDGHGGRSVFGYGPVPPEGYVATADDCDDTRDRVYPGAPELPDRLDNDCDGTADVSMKAAASPTAVAPVPAAAPTATPSSTPSAGTSGGSGGSTATATPTVARSVTPTSTPIAPSPAPTATATPPATAVEAASPTPTSTPSPPAASPTATPAVEPASPPAPPSPAPPPPP